MSVPCLRDFLKVFIILGTVPKKVKPLIEKYLLCEPIHRKNYFGKPNNFVFHCKSSFICRVGHHVQMPSGGAYRSALSNYGKSETGIDYFPSSRGGKIGQAVNEFITLQLRKQCSN